MISVPSDLILCRIYRVSLDPVVPCEGLYFSPSANRYFVFDGFIFYGV
nr:MAG TPA: hypothetical protein [Microviridae sp.]